MANLICDRDPRDGTLKYSHSGLKNAVEKIRYAVKRGDLTIVGDYSNNLPIDSHDLFDWACRTYPKFQLKLPLGMVKNTDGRTLDLLEFDVQSCGLDLPDTYQELRNKYVSLHLENIELKKEVKRLTVYEIGVKKGGENSAGAPKN